jgi:FkbM family methyltransferase
MKKFLVNLICGFIPKKDLRIKIRRKILSEKVAIFNGITFDVVPHHFWRGFNRAEWEPETQKFYRKYVAPDKKIIDIGGWIGPTVLMAYALNPKRISVVEADPANYQILKRNCLGNYLDDKVELHNLCISNESWKVVTFGTSEEDSSTKRIGMGNVKVATMAALDFLKSQNLNEVNIIKIDIEGGEQFIEKGLDYISTFSGICVLLSVHIPFWDNPENTTRTLLKEFEKFDLYSEKEELMSRNEVENVMSSKKIPYAGFFSLILKTREKE